jgi:manganese efflux pump family protein
MSGIALALVAVALGLSNFAAAIGIGLSGVDGRLRIRIAIIFGFFEAGMPLLGLLVGQRVADSIGSTASYLGGGLLIATGLYTVVKARREASEKEPGAVGTGNLVLTGAVLSIDNLVVGFALGVSKVPLVLAAIVIAAVSVGCPSWALKSEGS